MILPSSVAGSGTQGSWEAWEKSFISALGVQIHQGASLNFAGNSGVLLAMLAPYQGSQNRWALLAFLESQPGREPAVKRLGGGGRTGSPKSLQLCQPPTSRLSSLTLLKVTPAWEEGLLAGR